MLVPLKKPDVCRKTLITFHDIYDVDEIHSGHSSPDMFFQFGVILKASFVRKGSKGYERNVITYQLGAKIENRFFSYT